MGNNYTFQKFFLFCVLFLSFFSCVQEQSLPQVSSKDNLTVETARLYYEKALKRLKTRALSGIDRSNLFYREAYYENWENAYLFQTDKVESVDVPVNEQRQYYVVSRDGGGYYLTRGVEVAVTGMKEDRVSLHRLLWMQMHINKSHLFLKQ